MPIRIAVVTCVRNGTASLCLPMLCAHPNIEVVGVFLANGSGTSKWRTYKRRIAKILRIGVLGAWNGKRMRPWFRIPHKELSEICREAHLPYSEIDGLNSPQMITALHKCGADLGVSLGNGYIAPRVFQVPPLGMINLHSEVLPAYQNAQSIIWPIYMNDPYTGFTIHEIERKIDSGRILFQVRQPIEFAASLEGTVRKNRRLIEAQIPEAVADVCAHIASYKQKAVLQVGGATYTTPSFWQYLRMVAHNRRFYRFQEAGK